MKISSEKAVTLNKHQSNYTQKLGKLLNFSAKI